MVANRVVSKISSHRITILLSKTSVIIVNFGRSSSYTDIYYELDFYLVIKVDVNGGSTSIDFINRDFIDRDNITIAIARYSIKGFGGGSASIGYYDNKAFDNESVRRFVGVEGFSVESYDIVKSNDYYNNKAFGKACYGSDIAISVLYSYTKSITSSKYLILYYISNSGL